MPPLQKHPLLLFAAYLGASGVLAALIAPLIWPLLDYPFERVLSRLALLIAALLLVPVLRIAALTRSEIGFHGFAAGRFARDWCLGIALILPPAVFFLLIDFRVFDPRVAAEPLEVARVALLGVISGLAIGVFEETLFRGVLLGVWLRVQPKVAIWGSSAAYALVHFVEADEHAVPDSFWAGFQQLGAAFAPLASPGAYWDSFVGLFLLGVGLAWVRLRTGSLWTSIALHAAFVTFLKVYKDVTIRDIDVPLAWVVGTYDNFVGEATALWLLVILIVAWLWSRQPRPFG